MWKVLTSSFGVVIVINLSFLILKNIITMNNIINY